MSNITTLTITLTPELNNPDKKTLNFTMDNAAQISYADAINALIATADHLITEHQTKTNEQEKLLQLEQSQTSTT